jgi:isocitrate/isopropylmalate dehydrogenase
VDAFRSLQCREFSKAFARRDLFSSNGQACGRIINPTATMLSAVPMLDYLGFGDKSKRFESAVRKVYEEGKVLTPDQGGSAKTGEFTKAVIANL